MRISIFKDGRRVHLIAGARSVVGRGEGVTVSDAPQPKPTGYQFSANTTYIPNEYTIEIESDWAA